jgi:tRNA 2-selenouridine synthase
MVAAPRAGAEGETQYTSLMTRYEITADLSSAALQGFDAVIDARSPGEFAEDALPGAINLPVLDDGERAHIGTIYKQVSPFQARREGAALVSRNIGRHIEEALSDWPKGFKPLVYCWRGGMRSNSFATVLAAVGWRVKVLDGGYRTWRRQVSAGLSEEDPVSPLILIDGQTGTAKTALLLELERQGEQVIDLEGLARHRGSVFGDFSDTPQPSQKRFETGLWTQLRALDPARPVYVEAESTMVGKRRVPKRLWEAMKAAPRIEIAAPVEARAEYLLTAYPDLAAEADKLDAAIMRLSGHHANADIEAWRDMAREGNLRALAAALVTAHYDPAYDRARKRHGGAPRLRLETASLDPVALVETANRLRQAALEFA